MNVNGALFTAQAAGQQMERFGRGGSIIMIASVSGHGTNKAGRVHTIHILRMKHKQVFFFVLGLRVGGL